MSSTSSDMKTHTIHWKSRANGMKGAGTILFEKEVAERLAEELNRDYPGILHEAVFALPVSQSVVPQLAGAGSRS
jgi:hypothetical protein